MTVIKSELDLALLLHGNRLRFNYSVPWEIGIPTVIQETPPSSHLPIDFWHSLSASPQLRGYSFIPPFSACRMTSLFSGNVQIGKSGIFQALFSSQFHIQFCQGAVLPFPALSDMAQDNVSRDRAQPLHVRCAGFLAVWEFPCFPCSFGSAQSCRDV